MIKNICRFLLLGLFLPWSAQAWELSGTKQLALTTRDGQSLVIGTVTFTPHGDGSDFTLNLDLDRFKDYFLSMREFKCLDGQDEVQCYVPYPYAHPRTVSATNLQWLEHSLLFFYKTPTEFGAKLWNGLYYQLHMTEQGLVGIPALVDLNQISSPPADLTKPPFQAADQGDLAPGTRWFSGLTIR